MDTAASKTRSRTAWKLLITPDAGPSGEAWGRMNTLSSWANQNHGGQPGNTDIPARDVSQIRLICRHATQLLLNRSQRWTPLWPSARMAGLVIETTLSATTAHLPYCTTEPEPRWLGLDDALEGARPLSVLAISRSLNLPYGSMARRVDELVVSGLLLKDSRGVRVAPTFLVGEQPAQVCTDNKADLQHTLLQLAAAGYAPAPDLLSPALDQVPATVVERALVAFSLRVLEGISTLYGDAVSGLLAAAVIAINVHHLTEDPVLAQRFAAEDTPPPDELRRPVTVRELARITDTPFETARRRINDLRAQGIIEMVDDGVIVPARALLRPQNLADNRRIVQHFEQMLKLLSTLAAHR